MEKELIRKKSIEILDYVDDEPVFIKSLHELFTSLVDEKRPKTILELIVDTGKFYGVPKPSLWIIAAEIRKFILKYSDKASDILATLWGEGSYEARQIAGKSVEKNTKFIIKEGMKKLTDEEQFELSGLIKG